MTSEIGRPARGLSPVSLQYGFLVVQRLGYMTFTHETRVRFPARVCEGISPLGYWQEVNQSPTQTKPYNTLPPFEQRDAWSSYGAVRAYSEVLL